MDKQCMMLNMTVKRMNSVDVLYHPCVRLSLQARGLRKAAGPTKGKLTYHKDNYLSLDLLFRGEEWTPCFTISNVVLPPVAYLGFSAHTGEISGIFSILLLIDSTDFHDILSVETKTIYDAAQQNVEMNKKKPEQKVEGIYMGKKGKAKSQQTQSQESQKKKGQSFGMFMLRVLAVLVIMAVAYFAWTAYRVRHGNRY
jgi:lectin, mannose-binding 2